MADKQSINKNYLPLGNQTKHLKECARTMYVDEQFRINKMRASCYSARSIAFATRKLKDCATVFKPSSSCAVIGSLSKRRDEATHPAER